jgi:hypothetical protein
MSEHDEELLAEEAELQRAEDIRDYERDRLADVRAALTDHALREREQRWMDARHTDDGTRWE